MITKTKEDYIREGQLAEAKTAATARRLRTELGCVTRDRDDARFRLAFYEGGGKWDDRLLKEIQRRRGDLLVDLGTHRPNLDQRTRKGREFSELRIGQNAVLREYDDLLAWLKATAPKKEDLVARKRQAEEELHRVQCEMAEHDMKVAERIAEKMAEKE